MNTEITINFSLINYKFTIYELRLLWNISDLIKRKNKSQL